MHALWRKPLHSEHTKIIWQYLIGYLFLWCSECSGFLFFPQLHKKALLVISLLSGNYNFFFQTVKKVGFSLSIIWELFFCKYFRRGWSLLQKHYHLIGEDIKTRFFTPRVSTAPKMLPLNKWRDKKVCEFFVARVSSRVKKLLLHKWGRW